MPPQRRNEIQLFYNTTFYVIVGITFLNQTTLRIYVQKQSQPLNQPTMLFPEFINQSWNREI